MKKSVIMMLALLFAGACSDKPTNPTTDDITSTEVNVLQTSVHFLDFMLPAGTEVESLSDHEVLIILPEHYDFLIKNNDIQQKTRKVRYNCSCSTQDGGCNVLQFENFIGCNHGTCTGKCIGSIITDEEIGDRHYNSENNKYVSIIGVLKHNYLLESLNKNSSADTRFSCSSLTYSKSVDFESNVQSFFHNAGFVSQTEEHERISRLNYVGLKFDGIPFVLEIDDINLDKLFTFIDSKQMEIPVLLSDYSCECESGDSGCVKDSYRPYRLGPTINRCSAGNCWSCSMLTELEEPGN